MNAEGSSEYEQKVCRAEEELPLHAAFWQLDTVMFVCLSTAWRNAFCALSVC